MTPPRFVFSPEKFPLTIMALHPKTRKVVWSRTIECPDSEVPVIIPPLKAKLGHPVAIRVTYADGTEDVIEPQRTQ